MLTKGEAAVAYRQKAKIFRAMADDLLPEARAALLRVADEYERMAAKAAEPPPTDPPRPPVHEGK